MDKNFYGKRLRNKCAMTCIGNTIQEPSPAFVTFANAHEQLLPQHKADRVTHIAQLCGSLCLTKREGNSFNDKVFSRFTSHFSLRKTAFTLAEVLITLGIIGVVAALTIPTLMVNHRRKVTATRLKQSYNILYNAIKASEAENGSWLYWDAPEQGGNTKEFAEKYILPYLKYTDIGEQSVFATSEGEDYYIKLVNGTIVGLHMGACMDFLVDINGEKAPNKFGYDQFDFLLNVKQSNASSGYPKEFGPKGRDLPRNNLKIQCQSSDTKKCAALIELDGWEIAKDYPHRI